jgi:transcriptional regulatory protein RtcR
LKDIVVFGFLDTIYDRLPQGKGKPEKRREKTRPSVLVCQKSDHYEISAYYLIYEQADTALLKEVVADIRAISPKTKVHPVSLEFNKTTDPARIFFTVGSYLNGFKFKLESKRYLFHFSTGCPARQLVAFKLTESRIFPGKLLFFTPPDRETSDQARPQVIDPELTAVDRLHEHVTRRDKDADYFLKSGIDTKNKSYNQLISLIQRVAITTTAPLLFSGPGGAGKTQLVTRLLDLKRQRGLFKGEFIRFNCAALWGDISMPILIGYGKDAVSGVNKNCEGLLMRANKGVLFLDEISELGLSEQAVLLNVVEHKHFLPLGADKEAESDFQLIAGTRLDLHQLVREGKFRADLLALLSQWTFHLPALKDRVEDFEANLDYELKQFEKYQGKRIRFHADAREDYLKFASSPTSCWAGNFRDFHVSISRMAAMAKTGMIDTTMVATEITTLNQQWEGSERQVLGKDSVNLADFLAEDSVATIDEFDLPQLKHVIWICQQSRSAAEAGRRLFNHSRKQKRSSNDTSRLAKYLGRFNLQFQDVANHQQL